jgi:hypothetical protein
LILLAIFSDDMVHTHHSHRNDETWIFDFLKMNILIVVGLLLTIKEENELQRAAGGIKTFTLGGGISSFNAGQL